LTKISLLIVACLCLTGCGAKGALFLPNQQSDAEKKSEQQNSSETESKDEDKPELPRS